VGAEHIALSAGGGQGGVSRGPGHAPLDFNGETAENAERFAEHALPPGALDLERSQLLGVGAGAPQESPSAEASSKVSTQLSAGEASWKRRLAPQHREAVRTFFSGDKR